MRWFLFEDGDRLKILCCPEDLRSCGAHAEDVVCSKCQVPLCATCWHSIRHLGGNYWGYLNSFIVKYEVQFIEMLIATPVWTTTSVFTLRETEGTC